jgi:O-Antigen ligase
VKATTPQPNTVLTESLKPVNLLILLLFFGNTFLMPHGLSLSFFLTPVFIYYIFQSKQSIKLLFVFLLILAVFGSLHLLNGVQLFSFFKSNVLFIAAMLSFIAAYQYFRLNGERLADHFKQINLYNFSFFLLALVLLFIPLLRNVLWSQVSMGHNIDRAPRLQLFSPEPSHYALLLSPVLIYYILSFLIEQKKSKYLLSLVMIAIPFLLSFSFGNFMAVGVSILMALLLFWKNLLLSKKNLRILFFSAVSATALALLIFALYPENFITKRLSNVLNGADSSANGRTFQSFGLAWHLAKTKSIFWGIGLGQIKEMGGAYYRDFFPYISTIPDPVRIPNSNAEVLATFGTLGLCLKTGITGLVFLWKKLYRNIFSTTLFIFIFIFQFMGSYLINFTELFIWALIFANPFQKFNK